MLYLIFKKQTTMRVLLFFIMAMTVTNTLSAQLECYEVLKKAGNIQFAEGNYSSAILKWEGAKKCEPPSNNDLDVLITKATKANGCKSSREEAEKAYILKDYDTAIALWQSIITKCGDITNTDDLQKRITEANRAKECGKWKEEGQTSFDKKQYDVARSLWTKALNCPNISESEKKELTALIKKTVSVDTIYQLNQVDKEPKFDTRIVLPKSVKSWIEENTRYSGLESELAGVVDVSFIINKDGSITDAKIIKGISAVCDSEAIRLIRIMPKWDRVGSINKKPVKVLYEMGIEFIDVNKTYRVDEVDKKPSGNELWVATNLRYPPTAQRNRVQGTVLLDFLVDKDGSISDIKIRQELGSGCSQEALRLIQNMPKWNSGTKQGQKVKVLYTSYPINFTLPSTPQGGGTTTESTTSTFVIKPIQVNCIAMDDGIEMTGFPPRPVTDRDGEIYGQVSMRVEGAGNFNYVPSTSAPLSTLPFWRLSASQSMRQGRVYNLDQSLSRRVSIPSSTLNTARFVLIANDRSSDGKANGIFESDPRTGDENLRGTPPTNSISFDEIKRLGSKTITHRFTTGTGKNVIDFVYQIEYIR